MRLLILLYHVTLIHLTYSDENRNRNIRQNIKHIDLESFRVNINEFPFIVTIQKDDGFGNFIPSCTGSVISHCLVLSVAQCFMINRTVIPLNEYVIYGGTSDTTDLKFKQWSDIDTLHLHAKYNYKNKDHNVGLVKVRRSFLFNKYLRPVVLMQTDWYRRKEPSDYFSIDECVVNGWSCPIDSNSSYKTFLNSIPVPLIPNSICTLYSHVNLGDAQLCTIFMSTVKEEFCLGDLLVCRNIQVGLLSWNFGVDIWNRIDKYYDWIHEINETYNTGRKFKDNATFVNIQYDELRSIDKDAFRKNDEDVDEAVESGNIYITSTPDVTTTTVNSTTIEVKSFRNCNVQLKFNSIFVLVLIINFIFLSP